jgi:hypothetical protein
MQALALLEEGGFLRLWQVSVGFYLYHVFYSIYYVLISFDCAHLSLWFHGLAAAAVLAR